MGPLPCYDRASSTARANSLSAPLSGLRLLEDGSGTEGFRDAPLRHIASRTPELWRWR